MLINVMEREHTVIKMKTMYVIIGSIGLFFPIENLVFQVKFSHKVTISYNIAKATGRDGE